MKENDKYNFMDFNFFLFNTAYAVYVFVHKYSQLQILQLNIGYCVFHSSISIDIPPATKPDYVVFRKTMYREKTIFIA